MPTNFLRYAGTANNGLLVSVLTLMTTELESLANAAVVVSSVNGSSGLFNNSNTGQGIWGELFYEDGNVAFTATAGANLTGWWLTTPDGSTFEYTTSSVPPARPPDFLIPLPAQALGTVTVYKSSIVRIPALPFKVCIQNNAGNTTGAGATTAPYLNLAVCADQY